MHYSTYQNTGKAASVVYSTIRVGATHGLHAQLVSAHVCMSYTTLTAKSQKANEEASQQFQGSAQSVVKAISLNLLQRYM